MSRRKGAQEVGGGAAEGLPAAKGARTPEAARAAAPSATATEAVG